MKKEPDYKWAAEKLKLLSSEEDDQFFKIIYARAAKIARDKAQKLRVTRRKNKLTPRNR